MIKDEKKRSKLRGGLKSIITQFKWIINILAVYGFMVYLANLAIWIMLGALLNPNAVLPYFGGIATFFSSSGYKFKGVNKLFT